MRHTLPRAVILCLALMALAPPILMAFPPGDHPGPVAASILRTPRPEHLPTLVGALRGSGCKATHTDVGDAIVSLGSRSVPSLVARLESSDKWWIQLETIYLLGLIGPDAKKALPALDTFLSEKHHPLPARNAAVAVAAIRGDIDTLIAKIGQRAAGANDFAIELLGRRGTQARAALPALEKHIATHPFSTTRATAETAIKSITQAPTRGLPPFR
ncbi:MAG: hypothetical protein QGH11_07390 [Pirellulaceae bacterium]|nr:hypothetical protein [Pirellulaceae bacterium]